MFRFERNDPPARVLDLDGGTCQPSAAQVLGTHSIACTGHQHTASDPFSSLAYGVIAQTSRLIAATTVKLLIDSAGRVIIL